MRRSVSHGSKENLDRLNVWWKNLPCTVCGRVVLVKDSATLHMDDRTGEASATHHKCPEAAG